MEQARFGFRCWISRIPCKIIRSPRMNRYLRGKDHFTRLHTTAVKSEWLGFLQNNKYTCTGKHRSMFSSTNCVVIALLLERTFSICFECVASPFCRIPNEGKRGNCHLARGRSVRQTFLETSDLIFLCDPADSKRR